MFENFIFLTRRRHYGNSFVVSLNGIILEGAETFFEIEMNLNNMYSTLINVFYRKKGKSFYFDTVTK